jgi:hypothetical protein
MIGHMRRLAAVVFLLALAAPAATAQSSRMIRVGVDFRQTAQHSRDAGLSVERRVNRSTGVFTLVQDGGEATLTVAAQIPYQQIAFYRDYASGAGHVAAGVAFQDVGTSLRVQAVLLPRDQIRVRLTPRITYVAPDGSGAIEFTEAATEVVVPSGRPVVLAGSSTRTHALLRHVLGVAREQGRQDTTVVLTATVR